MKTQKQQGFTIIEVVLVLAIAGLIFLVVFLAVPALQRSQRDTARRNDLSRFMAQVNSYQANNTGQVPADSAAGITGTNGLQTTYLKVGGDTFGDPRGNDYTYVYGPGGAPTPGQIRYADNARCGANGSITGGGTSRQVAASIGLEGGGAYCQQN